MVNFSPFRAAIVFICLIGAFLTLIGRVAYLQSFGRQQTIRRAERQQHQNSVLPARRGSIYDANGILMAGTIETKTLFIDAKFMFEAFQSEGRSLVDMDNAIEKLAHALDKDAFGIAQLLSSRADARFLKIAEGLDETVAGEIEKMKIPGTGLIPTSARTYPMGSLASHILGTSGKDGHGLEGLELKFDKLLSGKDGFIRELKDARRRPIRVSDEDYIPAEHGEHLVLTVDSNIQMIAEQELAATCERQRAKRGEVVVMDPKTGEILALANWPTFNPQNLDDSTNDLRRNRALTDPYEPGSTIKPFIVGPALMWKSSRINEVFPLKGEHWRTPYGRPITDVHGYNDLTLWDVLVKSSNIGMCMLSERMGNTKLHTALTAFGFGKPTGIELPGEDGGRVNPLARWSKFSTDSVAQGYELMVTPVQLVRAFSAYANGGKLVEPQLVKGVLGEDGHVKLTTPADRTAKFRQVLDSASAMGVRRILADVPVRGTARGAGSKVWNIFGKTGTAHISGGKAGYSDSKFTSSFIGGAPFENPRLVCAFIIHEPDKSIAHYGGAVAAPGACKMLERCMTYLQVPGSPDLQAPPDAIASLLHNFNPKIYLRKKETPTPIVATRE